MSGIANFGSFAGGLMRGHLAATEEQRREEDQAFQRESQAFLKQQRDEALDEMRRKQAVRQGIAAMPAVGSTQTRRVLDPSIEGGDYDESFTYTPEMRQQALAGLYRSQGFETEAAGAEDREYLLFKQARERGQIGRVDAALAQRAKLHEEARKDLAGFMERRGGQFNADLIGGPRFAGHTLAMASTPNGQIGYMINPQGQTVGSIPITLEAVSRFIDSLTDDELSAASPEMYSQVAGRGLQRRQLGATEMTAQAAMRNAESNEGYRQWLQGRPTLMPTGSGKVVAIDPTGTRQLGMFGESRPAPGSGGAALRDPKAYAAAVEEFNKLAEEFATATTPAKRAELTAKMNVVEIKMANAAGRPAQIRGTNAPRPDISFKDFVAAFPDAPTGQVDRKTGRPVPLSQLPPDQQFAVYQRMMSGGGAQGGLPDAPPPSSGLSRPTAPADAAGEDTTKYIREKSPRGGYIYTPSPRGMTKAQYAEIDSQGGK